MNDPFLGNLQLTFTLETAESLPCLATEPLLTDVQSDHPAWVVLSQERYQHTLSTLCRTEEGDRNKQT